MASTMRTILKQLDNFDEMELAQIQRRTVEAINSKNLNKDIWKDDNQMKIIINEYMAAIEPVKIKINAAIPIRGEIELVNDDESFVQEVFASFNIKSDLEDIYSLVFDGDNNDALLKKYFPEAAGIIKKKNSDIDRILGRAEKRMEELKCNYSEFIEHIEDLICR